MAERKNTQFGCLCKKSMDLVRESGTSFRGRWIFLWKGGLLYYMALEGTWAKK